MTAEDRMRWALRKIIIGFGLVVAALVLLAFLLARNVFAADLGAHTHEGATGRFYKTWMMPENRGISCCHDQDCAPAHSRFQNGKWQSRYSTSDDWTEIPAEKIETERDSPDGQSHLCARKSWYGLTVLCFLPAAGG